MTELIDAIDRNQVEAWRRLLLPSPTGREAVFGSVRAIVTGSPLDLFNPVFAVRPMADVEAELGEAIRYVRSAGVPPLVYVHRDVGPEAEALLEAGGLGPAGRSMPGMVLDPIRPAPAVRSVLEIRRIGDPAGLAEATRTVARGFGMPAEPVREVFTPSMLEGEGFVLLCGYLNGVSVATSMLVLTDGMAGVYTVAVVPEARRRGFGRLLTQAAIQEGAARGATRACLQASAMGEPVYVAMGFRTVTSYRLYAELHPSS